ncbi:MAG: PilW family protein [Archangium sp.]|nr:PilW family protein [Archangium sp.]MDP3154764.1 PilW family protein [Archangium sp.]MDP3573654.1 PilW family protein [Archangium sp.]
MNTSHRSRGFTLAELLVGLVVTSIVMTAVVAIFIGVQRSYQAETEVKIITENGRGTMLFLERVLPLAGYGLDPRVAFDVAGTQSRDNQDVQAVSFTTTFTQKPLPGPAARTLSDDLAFRFRDPAFLRAGRLNSGNTQVTLDAALGMQLPTGKLLMVGCRGGADYTMVRVVGTPGPTATTITVTNAAGPFITSSAPCLTQTGASSPWVFLIQEHRLRVVNLAGRPWLVSFRNLEASVTDLTLDNFDPIAPDVENFQVAFGMNRARPGLTCCQAAPDAAGNSNFIVGDVPGESFFAQPTGVLGTRPDYRTGYEQLPRFTAHPANIRSVHVAVVLRSTRNLPNGRTEFQTGSLFNSPVYTPGSDGFKRSLFHTTINTPNLLSRSNFMPSLRATGVVNDMNSWGG